VHMVGGIVIGGGLVRCSSGCVLVGVSSVFRYYLLPLIFPSADIQAIGPAKVYFPRVVQSSLRSLQSSYPLCPQFAACSGQPTGKPLAYSYIP
jgi:hypothetical protein